MASSYFVRELEYGGKTLRIKQLYVGDVGCVVWDAAIVLCKFLENGEFFPPGYWNGKRVVDIGSGTGVAGLAAAVMGSGAVGIIMFDAFLLVALGTLEIKLFFFLFFKLLGIVIKRCFMCRVCSNSA